jgi:Asp/Glu/hydantoin racemase
MNNFLVFNPNASRAMSQAMDRSLDGLRARTGNQFACMTNDNGPMGIESDADVAAVIPDVVRVGQSVEADAYIIACFSDPGLEALRQVTTRPVIGVGEAAYLTAIALVKRFGVISIVEASIGRHRSQLQRLGLDSRLAGDRAIEVGVADLHGGDVAAKLLDVAKALRDEDGAEAIILGCAGLGARREPLQRAIGIPVIDPVQAAAAQASTLALLELVSPADHERLKLGRPQSDS